MDEDEARPRKPPRIEPLVLDRLSIEELEAYIGDLRAEIARAEADIARKQGVRAGAEALFKK
ncbi:MAG TPA: DUF1192 domain-containing protein [Alphaproteobacteria bacterium]